jgi:hypothetical protein
VHGGGDFGDLLSLRHVDHLLSETSLRLPAFRIVKDGTTLSPSAYTKRARMGSRDVDDLIDIARAYRLFAEGATIVLQGLHRYWPPVSRLCRDLELVLTHPVQANAYLTPPVAQGLDVHQDAHDVFALQAHGRKHWIVVEAATPELDVVLEPGDCLYVPEGTPHAARTVDEPSLHLTIGIRSTKWTEVLRHAVEGVLAAEGDDPALPAGHATDAGFGGKVALRLEALAGRIRGLDPEALAQETARKFWSTRSPALGGLLVDIVDLDRIDDETTIMRRPRTVARLEARAQHVMLVLGDRELRLPVRIQPALAFVLETPRFRVGDLVPYLDPSSRLVLARRLVAEGLVLPDRG